MSCLVPGGISSLGSVIRVSLNRNKTSIEIYVEPRPYLCNSLFASIKLTDEPAIIDIYDICIIKSSIDEMARGLNSHNTWRSNGKHVKYDTYNDTIVTDCLLSNDHKDSDSEAFSALLRRLIVAKRY